MTMHSAQTALAERYEILEEIGRGGFGVVYKAEQRTTKQLVAIKVLNLATASDPAMRQEQRERFTREMALIGKLTSPHIVSLIDAGFVGDDPFMVLEYIRGRELAEVIKAGPIEPKQVKIIADQVLRALAEAHDNGIVHRDLKPPNIMLTGEGRRMSCKVLDFGIAGFQQSFNPEKGSITQQGQIRGTLEYMAPEQFMFFAEPTPQMDVYALGLVLCECLTGTRWIRPDTVSNQFKQHKEEPLALTPALRGSPWGAFLEKACAKDPSARFASADGMLEGLDRLDKGIAPTGPVSPDALFSDDAPYAKQLAPSGSHDIPSSLHSNPTLAISREVVVTRSKTPMVIGGALLLIAGAAAVGWTLLASNELATQAAEQAERSEDAPPPTAAAGEASPPSAAQDQEVAPAAHDEEAAAVEQVEEAEPTAPVDPVAELMSAAQGAVEKDEWSEALSIFEQVLALDPKNAAAQQGAGFALLALERYEEATPYFEAAKTVPKFAGTSTFGLAKVKAARDDLEGARTLCKDALELAPDGARAADAKALLEHIDTQQERAEKAAAHGEAPSHLRRSRGPERSRRRASGGVKIDTSI